MKANGMSDYTIESTRKALRIIEKHANLDKPEIVKLYISRKECSDGFKANLCNAYARHCKYYKIEWEKPKYTPETRQIRVPTKEKVEMLIAHAGRKMAVKIAISAETGLSPFELVNLKAKDVDLEQRVIYPRTAKHGAARPPLRISSKLQAMLKEYIARDDIEPDDKLFNTTPRNYSKMFRVTRNALAEKVHDPMIKTIRLYDLRHFYGTMEYHKTRDIVLVQARMGHKNIKNTLLYTHLLNLNDDEWICRGATNKEEAMQLIEAGFVYVTEIDGTKLFRKRK